LVEKIIEADMFSKFILDKKWQAIFIFSSFSLLAYTTKYRPFDDFRIQSKPYLLFQGLIDDYLVSWMGVNLASLSLLLICAVFLALIYFRNDNKKAPKPIRQVSVKTTAKRNTFGKR
jgi:hypothetical protein